MTENQKLRKALRELMSIVSIHQKATRNNFAWAEMDFAREALATTSQPAVPQGWKVERKGDLRIRVESPSGDAWSFENVDDRGSTNLFVYRMLDAMLTTKSQEPEPFDEREAFEREMRYRHGWNNSYFTQSNDGGYLSNRATYAYIGWQSRAAIEKSAAKDPGQKWWEIKCKNCEGTGHTDPGVADNPDGDGRPPVVCNECGGNGCGKEKP